MCIDVSLQIRGEALTVREELDDWEETDSSEDGMILKRGTRKDGTPLGVGLGIRSGLGLRRSRDAAGSEVLLRLRRNTCR